MLTLANRKSHNRYCESHNDHSHDTEVCVALCFEIEKMIMNGKLTRFLTNQQQQRPRQEQNPPRDHSPLRNNEGHQYEQRERQLAPRKNPLRNQEPRFIPYQVDSLEEENLCRKKKSPCATNRILE
jgi:hypothetical protein